MMMVSTPLCQRPAKARAALNRWHARGAKEGTTLVALRVEYAEAAAALADALIEQGAADMEGD